MPAHGDARRISEMPELHARPKEQQVVIEAVEVAAQRGLPLAPPMVGGKPINKAGTLPRQTPWSRLPPEALAKAQGGAILDSLASLAPRMAAVEREIEKLITTPIKLIADISSHTMNAGGKRLRPALTLICAELCGDDGENPSPKAVTCAAAIELTHTTTLLHDDVVDESDMRRGRPTARLLWGNEASVLVGDYLFAQVFVTASQRGFGELMQPLAMATAEMCAGVLLETQTRGYLQMTEKQYREIIALKTAALVDCACRLGAKAMDVDDEVAGKLAQFGHDIGMAFQIVDDVLDITATEGRIGKPVGNDIREGDVTLPMIRAMQVAPAKDKAEFERILALTANDGQIPESDVQRALEILRSCDAVDFSLGVAHGFIDSGLAQLDGFSDGPAKTMLHEIAGYVTSREK